MITLNAEMMGVYAQACAFVGNSLLKPMTQTSAVGIDPSFWAEFPDFGMEGVRHGADECAAYAEGLADLDPEKAVEQVSVEYTRLFVGPPKPAAPPWETMYRSDNVTVGFGDPTFEMRRLLREAGLQLSNVNHQYEDHMGLELLYLSVLCDRLATALAEGGEGEPDELAKAVRSFAAAHPASWIDGFSDRVEEAFPSGYFSRLLRLCKELLGLLDEAS